VKRYDAESFGLGDEFAFEVEQVVHNISTRPETGSPHLFGTRRALTPRFPYSIIYRTGPSLVTIVAISHQRRKPGYWLRRI
jgi:toxin ParE1/3/4